MGKARETARRMAGDDHAVITLEGGGGLYRRQPCEECPWRRENEGSFPAEAFKHSASTAYDGAMSSFSCHMSGAKKPATCAGFLLRNADNNIGVRISLAMGKINPAELSDGGADLFDSYREMAVANGVDPADPILRPCRANHE